MSFISHTFNGHAQALDQNLDIYNWNCTGKPSITRLIIYFVRFKSCKQFEVGFVRKESVKKVKWCLWRKSDFPLANKTSKSQHIWLCFQKQTLKMADIGLLGKDWKQKIKEIEENRNISPVKWAVKMSQVRSREKHPSKSCVRQVYWGTCLEQWKQDWAGGRWSTKLLKKRAQWNPMGSCGAGTVLRKLSQFEAQGPEPYSAGRGSHQLRALSVTGYGGGLGGG